MENRRIVVILSMLILSVSLLCLTGCQPSSQEDSRGQDIPSTTGNIFAVYQEVPVEINPQVKAYKVAEDLSNITNKERFTFSPEAKDLLVKNGFVVIPSQDREFFSVYEMNRYASSTPNFVTTDAMLHNYHLYFSYLLRSLEKNQLRSDLAALTEAMAKGSLEQYKELKGTEWENAAKRNVAFFTVAEGLLNPEAEIPSLVKKEVEAELKLIGEHQEVFTPSPVMNIGNDDVNLADAAKEDYTQYIPRGHYAKSEELQTYFKGMMWYGRLTFRASSEDETKSAALLLQVLGARENYQRWERIYEPTNFFVGKSDDLGVPEYFGLFKNIYEGIPSIEELTGEAEKWVSFREGIKDLDSPAINSMPIFDENIQPDKEKEIKGFRFMGQRFTLDAAIFQRLIYREVGENPAGDRRMLPKALDIPATLGSGEALAILEEMGETKFANYPENMVKMRKYAAKLDMPVWTQNLYWSWLYTLGPLTEAKAQGYPSFMTNQAWSRKQLETYLGSWTELKHDTILYAKQVYAEMGGGDEPEDDRGYVEPNPVVFARLAGLVRMTIDGLESRQILTDNDRVSLERMEELALKLKTISEKELTNEPLDEDDYDLIRGFGGQLEHFWLEALKDEGVDTPSAVYENPAALIADVATDPTGQVLEEGTGFVSNIYVVVPVEGKLRIALGAVYSYYEFPWPASDRLTDQKWKEMLESGNIPDAPFWTKSYTGPAPEW